MISVFHLWQLYGGECFYCGRPTWCEHHESKRVAKARLGLATYRELRYRRATREHLHRRADGGMNGLHNLVLACNACNVARQTKPVLVHLANLRNVSA